MKNSFLYTAVALGLLGAAPASASIFTTIQSVVDAAGSTGGSFEVALTNTGAPVTIDSFSFGLNVASTDITFQFATIATAVHAYIFDVADSLFGPTISTTSPDQSIIASDLWAGGGNGFTLGTGVTVGLGEVFFNVAAGAVGPYPVSFNPTDTSLSDITGSPIPIDGESSGLISISTAPAPEPSTIGLMGLAAGSLGLWRRRRLRA
jgi:hypothetical protein